MANYKCPISFFDYDRISDTLMYFDEVYTLKFNVNLSRKRYGSEDRMFFSREVIYPSKFMNQDYSRTIRRDLNFFFSIDCKLDYRNSVVLRPADVYNLQSIIHDKVFPWLIGDKIKFGVTSDKKLILKGKYTEVKFIIDEYKYLSFIPIVIEYPDGTRTPGVRMFVNSPEVYTDYDTQKLVNFYQLLTHTDMYAVACSMINYVKMAPYGVNVYDTSGANEEAKPYQGTGEWNNTSINRNDSGGRNFFQKMKE